MTIREPVAFLFPLMVVVACGTSGTTQDGGGGGGGTTCHKQSDCGSGDYCGVTILAPMCAGACQPRFAGTTCQADADCADAGTGMICSSPSKPGPCWCSSGGAQPEALCVPGCSTAADCGPGLSCDSAATHRCVAANCTQPSDCGSGNFTCTSQACAPKACTGDGDCANFCVFNQCAPTLGTCAPAVP